MSFFDKAKDFAEDALEKAKDVAENVADKVQDLAENVTDKVKDAVDDESIDEYAEKIKGVTPDSIDKHVDAAADKAKGWNDDAETPGGTTAV